MTHSEKNDPHGPWTAACRSLAFAALVAGLTAPATGLSQAPAASHAPAQKPAPDDVRAEASIVGTWEATIAPSDESIPPFLGFYTFFADGNALFSSAGPPLPALGNPGHGIWKQVGPVTFELLIRQMTFDETLQSNGSLRIAARITMKNPDAFTTVDDVRIYDPEGNEVVALGGSALARRMVIPPSN
jgi:hypothetical protein